MLQGHDCCSRNQIDDSWSEAGLSAKQPSTKHLTRQSLFFPMRFSEWLWFGAASQALFVTVEVSIHCKPNQLGSSLFTPKTNTAGYAPVAAGSITAASKEENHYGRLEGNQRLQGVTQPSNRQTSWKSWSPHGMQQV